MAKSSEDKREASNRNRFRALAGKTSDVVIILGRDGSTTYASPSAGAFGCKPKDMIGMRVMDLYHPDDYTSVQRSAEL